MACYTAVLVTITMRDTRPHDDTVYGVHPDTTPVCWVKHEEQSARKTDRAPGRATHMKRSGVT